MKITHSLKIIALKIHSKIRKLSCRAGSRFAGKIGKLILLLRRNRKRTIAAGLAIILFLSPMVYLSLREPEKTLAAKLEIKEGANSIQIDVPNRFRAILQKGDTDNYMVFFDRAEDDKTPNATHEFKGPCILESNTYCLRDDGNRKTTILESSSTRVVVRVEGRFNNEASTDYLDDDQGNGDINVVVDYTFTTEGVFVSNTTDFKVDGLGFDSDSGHNGYEWLGVWTDITDAAFDDAGNNYYGDGATETTISANGEFTNTNHYLVLPGTGSDTYQDAYVGIMQEGWFDDTNSGGVHEWNWTEDDVSSQLDLISAQEQNYITRGKHTAKWFFLLMAENDIDSELEREGIINDYRNPDTLSYSTGDLWDNSPEMSTGIATSSAVLLHPDFEGGDSNLCDGGDGWTGGDCDPGNSVVGNYTTTVYNGTYSAKFVSTDSTNDSAHVTYSGVNHQTLYVRMNFLFETENLADTNAIRLMTFRDITNTQNVDIDIEENSGNLELEAADTNGSETGMGSDAYIKTGVWYTIEAGIFRHPTLGTIQVWLDGKEVYYATGQDTGDGVTELMRVGIIAQDVAATNEILLDNVIFSESYIGTGHYNEGQGSYTVDAASNHAEFDIDGFANLSTTLNGAASAGATSVTLTSVTDFPDGGGSTDNVAYIEGDKITYNDVSGSTLAGIPTTGENAVNYHASGAVVSRSFRHSPTVKMRGYRSNTLPDEAVLEGVRLQKDYDFIADQKPFSSSYFADEITWHSTLESSSAVTSPNIGDAGTSSGTDYVVGKYGNAARFDANSEYVSVNTATNLDKNNGSLDFWYSPAYASTDNAEHNLIGFLNSGDTFQIIKEDSTGGECNSNGNCLVFVINEDASNRRAAYFTTSDYSWSTNDWVHIRAVWDETLSSSDLNLYLNGVAATNKINDGSYTAANLSVPATLYVGNDASTGSEEANGIIDELYVYDSAASTTTPATIGSGGHDYSGNDHLSNENRDYTLSFTDDDANNRGEYIWLGSNDMFSGVNVDLETEGVGSSEDFDWEYWNGTAWSALTVTEQETGASEWLADGNFYFSPPPSWVPYSVNGSTDLYYIRGHLEGGSFSTTPVENKVLTDIVTFQYVKDNGIISSDNQTFELPGWTSNSPPVVYWKFDEGYGTTANDSTGNNNPLTIKDASWQEESLCISGKCLNFDGSADMASKSAQLTQLDFKETNSFTLSGWFRHSSTISGTDTLISKFESTGSDGGYKVYMDSSGYLCLGVDDDNTWGPDDSACSTSSYADSKWHHFSAVKTDTTQIDLYIDGQVIKTDDNIAATSTLENNDGFYIGADETGYLNYWDGFIDEVKVYRYARSADEIKSDFIQKGSVRGTSASFGDQQSWLSDGLVGYWKMDEDSTGNTCSGGEDSCDSSGNGFHLDWTPQATSIAGKFGNGTTYDGTDDTATCTDANCGGIGNLDFGAGSSYSYGAWYKSTDTDAYLVSKKNRNLATAEGYQMSLTNSALSCWVADGSVQYYPEHDITTNDDSWHHGFCVVENDVVRVYVDGQLVKTDSDNGLGNKLTGSYDNTVPFRLGLDNQSNQDYEGELDEARVYNRALTPTEVQQLYRWAPGPVAYYPFDEGTGTSTVYDLSGNGNNGTINGSMTESDWMPGKYGSALDFDGNDDYTSCTDANCGGTTVSGLDMGTRDWTVSSWVNTSNTTTGVVASKSDFTGGSNPDAWAININSSGTVNSWIRDNGTGQVVSTDDGATVNDGNWHFIAVTFDRNGNMSRYVDGVQTGTQDSISSLDGVTIDNTEEIRLGARDTSSSQLYFDGLIDNVRIYNYTRTAEQIIEDMNAGHPAPGSPVGSPILHLKFDEGYGDVLNDSSTQDNDGDLSGSGVTCPGGAATCPTWNNSGKFGKALDFDKADRDYVEITGLLDTPTNITLAAWVDFDSVDTWNSYVISLGDYVVLAADDTGSPGGVKGQYYIGSSSWNSSKSDIDIAGTGWRHIAYVVDDTNDIQKVYIDGVEVVANFDTESIVYIGQGSNTFIGRNGAGFTNDDYDGRMDEVQVFNSALTDDQIKLLYNQGKAAVWGAKSSNTSGTGSYDALSEYCPPGSTDSCTGPAAEWKFDENQGISANDTSDNANTGTLTNGPAWVPGNQSSALDFDASNDYVTVSDNSSLDFSTSTNFTLSAWVKMQGTSKATQRIISKTDATVGDGGWSFHYNANPDALRMFVTNDDSNNYCTMDASTDIEDNQWHHISVVVNRNASCTTSDMSFYVDGKQETVSVFSSTGDANQDVDNDDALEIGTLASAGYFDGFIDEARVYNYARTPAQIAWEYNQGKPISHWRFDECSGDTAYDSGSGGNDGTIYAQTVNNVGVCGGTAGDMRANGTTGKRNASLGFGVDVGVGVDDYVDMGTISDHQFSDNFSVSAWVNVSNYGANRGIVTHIHSASNYGWGLTTTDSSILQFIANSASGLGSTPVDNNPSTGEWFHLVGVRRSGTNYVYLNGVQQSTTTTAAPDTGAVDTVVGRWRGDYDGLYFYGLIDEVKIFNYALTDQQIKNEYNDGTVRFSP
jgi:hypothetical protein